jgi:hypothetical protein
MSMNTQMTTIESTKNERFMSLVGDLQTDLKNLIKKEIELAKTEMGEKFKVVGRNVGFMAGGAIVALMAVFLLLLAFGAIIAQLLQKADITPGTAYFVSYLGLGVLLVVLGYGLIHKAISAFSSLSLTPEKTLATAKGEPVPIHVTKNEKKEKKDEKEIKVSSEQLQNEVENTRARMDSEIYELKNRLTPGYMAKSFVAGMKHHPMRAVIAAALTTGVGGLIYWRKSHVAHAAELKRIHLKRRGWLMKLRHA